MKVHTIDAVAVMLAEKDVVNIVSELRVDPRFGFKRLYSDLLENIAELKGVTHDVLELIPVGHPRHATLIKEMHEDMQLILQQWEKYTSAGDEEQSLEIICEAVQSLHDARIALSRVPITEVDEMIARQIAQNLQKVLKQLGKAQNWFINAGPFRNKSYAKEMLDGRRIYPIQTIVFIAKKLGIDPELLYAGINPKSLDFAPKP